MKFEILIPFFNEAPRLAMTVETMATELRKHKPSLPIRFWWADDGSTDNSAQILSDLLEANPVAGVSHQILRRDLNRGKGSILRYVIERMEADVSPASVVGFWDSDGELDPLGLLEGMEAVLTGSADIVFGTRFGQGMEHQAASHLHLFGNRLLTLFSNTCSGLRLTDVHCCARMLRASTLFQLPLQSEGFDFEAEFAGVVGRICEPKPRIREMFVRYTPRNRSEGKKIGMAHVFPQILSALRCRTLVTPIRLRPTLPNEKNQLFL